MLREPGAQWQAFEFRDVYAEIKSALYHETTTISDNDLAK